MKTQDAKYLMLKERQEAEVRLLTDGKESGKKGWLREGREVKGGQAM